MELEIIKHSDITEEDLMRVIDIKNAAWPHSIESQLKWIEDNQHPEDLHVILKEGDKDYAYMDLCPVAAIVDGCTWFFMGIGNVCSKTKGLGHGGVLMTLVNDYLTDNKLCGLLFCREQVVHFYERYNWIVVSTDRVSINGKGHDGVYVMCFNTPSFKSMVYSDRDF